MLRKKMMCGLLLLSWLPIMVAGCSHKDEDVNAPPGPPPAGAPIDNKAPAAATAPAAPGVTPGTPPPGGTFGGGGMKGKGAKSPGGQ